MRRDSQGDPALLHLVPTSVSHALGQGLGLSHPVLQVWMYDLVLLSFRAVFWPLHPCSPHPFDVPLSLSLLWIVVSLRLWLMVSLMNIYFSLPMHIFQALDRKSHQDSQYKTWNTDNCLQGMWSEPRKRQYREHFRIVAKSSQVPSKDIKIQLKAKPIPAKGFMSIGLGAWSAIPKNV